ncbi:hypothetical protein fh0823_15540 [Francisella halioticida]|uniref:Acetyltransferase n=1 Tax=Francisella halioticida TaxID=549298 RepID=A0ABM6M0Y8_9GAMM|nr:CatB-related O-acetyltransferase [Francisella halioticida]ASG68521.1 hypothetical protein CDV26_09075 [Francisella halioticida]BCD91415.1 hypothetical protein fh0823_15540 [Francisella halioticida]
MIEYIKRLVKSFIFKIKFPNSRLYANVNIDASSSVGKHTVLFRDVNLQNTQVGDYTYIQKNTSIVSADIGKFCSIASNVNISLANHPIDMVSTNPIFYSYTNILPRCFTKKVLDDSVVFPRTIISSDVWIGQGVKIKAGVTIGVGAVIAAGAVVVKDVEPYSIVGGVPAKHIKYRFDEETIARLIKSEWWNLSDERLVEITPLFKTPSELLEILERNSDDKL